MTYRLFPDDETDCICQGCGQPYQGDLIVGDWIWEIIKPEGKPEGGGLLCANCILKQITRGRFGSAVRGLVLDPVEFEEIFESENIRGQEWDREIKEKFQRLKK